MDDAFDVPDSTDWLNTPLKDLAALENSLHCQICKEFYDTPMITTCNHTFCSKCIRTSLSADGKCPACRASDQASKLRNNWALQEVVSSFLTARPSTLKVARNAQAESQNTPRRGKRKRGAIHGTDDGVADEVSGRTTRSKSRRIAASQDSYPESIEIDDSEDGEELSRSESVPDDGLVECPLGCGKRMKEEQVFGHLDRCEDEQKQAKRVKSRTPVNGVSSSRPASSLDTRPQDRINELNYSMMKDNALSKKLKEIGIPNFGSKQLMVTRHKEWVNIWNANCDSNKPRSRRDLLRELDTWERTQGGRAPNANGVSSTIMRKDFDGDAYSKRHQDEFSRLIADAKRKKNIQSSAKPEDGEKAHRSNGVDESPQEVKSPSPIVTVTQRSHDQVPEEELIADIHPYEDNPVAMSSIREKVNAVNRGEEIKPLLNEGFRLPLTDLSEHTCETHVSTDLPPSNSGNVTASMHGDIPIHLGQAHHGPTDASTPSRLASREGLKSRDEHVVQDKTGSPCDIASHMDLKTPNHVKKVPMFEVSGQHTVEIDGAVAGS